MFALWLALVAPAHAVDTIPKDTLVDHLSELREQLEVDKLPIGYAGFDVEERLKSLVGPLDFVITKRMPATGDPEAQLKSMMKKTGSPCGLILSGGGRTVTIRTAGACAPELDALQEAVASCREKGLAETYTLEPTPRIELLRPSLPEGISRDVWDAIAADLSAGVAACVAAEGGELPESASLTLKAGWDAKGAPLDSHSLKGESKDALDVCAVRVTSCLPKQEAGDKRPLSLVIRVVEPEPTPAEEPTEAPTDEGSTEESP